MCRSGIMDNCGYDQMRVFLIAYLSLMLKNIYIVLFKKSHRRESNHLLFCIWLSDWVLCCMFVLTNNSSPDPRPT